ncbi:MAG TPA: hypothetical protein VFK05_33165 [Polyangiaceae bacterium]|nr:hypothetical protein [Polyangiaceae bacterium]
MTATQQSCLTRLDSQGRLLNSMVHSPSSKAPSRTLYRGDLAVKFAPTTEREKKPPELKVEQVLLAEDAGTLQFFAAYMLSFESLGPLAEVLGDSLTPDGKYFAYCNNIDLSSTYEVPMGKATFYVFPLDESSVFNELHELLKLDRNTLKKLGVVEKVDAIASAALKFNKRYERISYERGLELMGPVRDPGENRPV